jgi:hypothetical protein
MHEMEIPASISNPGAIIRSTYLRLLYPYELYRFFGFDENEVARRLRDA